MNKINATILLCLLFFISEKIGSENNVDHSYAVTSHFSQTPSKLKTLFYTINPQSIPQFLAFYDLYPLTPEGKQALERAWNLLSGTSKSNALRVPLDMTHPTIAGIIALVNKQPFDELADLSEEDLFVINHLSQGLANRKLKGFSAQSEAEVLQLEPDEIDLSRGLLLSEGEQEAPNWVKIRTYEAMLDLMSLQILSQLSDESSDEEKIEAINRFIFEDLGFRFPPHSCYAKNIDLYTFLPSVLDSRRGVCLGVSILYICIAQRLALNLEMITPPGHIYVRYRTPNKEINIETTARGIHLDSETYLGINTRSLQQRNIKEVIGLSHFNQASVYWITGEYIKALNAYSNAKKYLPHDMLLKELMGYNYVLSGDIEEGKKLLTEVKHHIPDYAIASDPLPQEYLDGLIDAEGIRTTFMPVDETRESLLEKQKKLEEILKKYPNFSSGMFHLASTYLQLHRESEALDTLKRFHQLRSDDPSAEYYLAVIYASRLNYPKAWEHLRHAENLVKLKSHYPKVLKQLRKELSFRCPE